MTEFDAEPMSNMEEIINKMSEHKSFTKMDCCNAYWQVGLSVHCNHLTAFETPKGLFQFKTMSFGLVSSGTTFCRLMGQVLANVPNVDSFVNDMWIFTETRKVHMTSLLQVLDRLSSGAGCSKLTMSLVNVSLKFKTQILQTCCYFLLQKSENLLQCKRISHFSNNK